MVTLPIRRTLRPTVEALEDRNLLTIGASDLTFNIGGRALMGFSGVSEDIAAQAVLQPDGKIVIAGRSDHTTSGSDGFAVMRITPDGDFDSEFTSTVIDFGTLAWGHAVALQPDGKILVAGRVLTPNEDMAFGVARLNADGHLDTSFNPNGPLPGTNILNPTIREDIPAGIAVRSDGKIIVGGTTGIASAALGRFGLIRLRTDGVLDTTFGTNGYAGLTTPITGGVAGSGVEASDVKLDENDNILVYGSNYTKPGGIQAYHDLVLARFKADGSGLDTTFNAGGAQEGVVVTDVSGNNIDYAGRLAVQTDGKILLVASTAANLGLVRVTPAGLLDGTFDNDGKVVLPVPGAISSGLNSTAINVQGSGRFGDPFRIVVTGEYRPTVNERDILVARVQNNGVLDTSFSDDGFQISQLYDDSLDTPEDVLVQADGKVVVVGTSKNAGTTTDYGFFLTRYENDRLAFGAGNYTVGENAGSAKITVVRTGGSTGTVTVQVTTRDGTATAGADYVPLTQLLTFGPDVKSQTFNVSVSPDAVAEGNETVFLSLSGATRAYVSVSLIQPSLVIKNEAPPPGAGSPAPRFVAEPVPAKARGVIASLVNRKGRGKTRKYIRVQWADTGEVKSEVACPFQAPNVRGLAVQALDSDGDGAADTVAVVAKQGKKALQRLLSVE